MSKTVVVLWSSSTADMIQQQNQRRLDTLLTSKNIDFIKIDGSVPENKEKRDELFAISTTRGNYPQCFFEIDGTHEFVGIWEGEGGIETMAECDDIPENILTENPQIKTFKKVILSMATKYQSFE
jgi:hypothetical protein